MFRIKIDFYNSAGQRDFDKKFTYTTALVPSIGDEIVVESVFYKVTNRTLFTDNLGLVFIDVIEK